jgi:hypothetical protein
MGSRRGVVGEMQFDVEPRSSDGAVEAPAQTPTNHQWQAIRPEMQGRSSGSLFAGPISIPGGKGTVELRTDGVIYVIWKPKGTIEAADALGALAAVNDVCGESEHLMLVDMAMTESVSREARSIFSKPCYATRIALLGSSPVDRLIANFFLGVHKPACPSRFFTSRNEAMAWLAQG